ncbi:hypothetical protein ACFL3C_04690 [Patescibacteria group bacterium]
MSQIIYLVGNLLVEEDSMPLKLASQLREAFPEIDFREFDPTENLPEDTDELVLIDTVEGLKKPHVFTKVEDFVTEKPYSMHDFDLGWQLKLYKKLRMINEVKIIGVPPEGNTNDILSQISVFIKTV